jgi:hypothetical protein
MPHKKTMKKVPRDDHSPDVEELAPSTQEQKRRKVEQPSTCGFTRGKLNDFMKQSNYGKNKLVFSAYFFKRDATQRGRRDFKKEVCHCRR